MSGLSVYYLSFHGFVYSYPDQFVDLVRAMGGATSNMAETVKVSSLNIYPVKGCRGISVSKASIGPTGKLEACQPVLSLLPLICSI